MNQRSVQRPAWDVGRLFKAILSMTLLYCFLSTAANAVGPNLLTNPGFEGGYVQYQLGTAFSIVNNPANAHTGNYELQANLTDSYTNAFQNMPIIWPNTTYTASVWVKGSGTMAFSVVGSDWQNTLGGTTIQATSTWQLVTFNWYSGSYTAAMFMFYDGGTPGTTFLDDLNNALPSVTQYSYNGQPFSPPAYAATPPSSISGMNLIFDSEFNEASNAAANTDNEIDINNTNLSGFQWYESTWYSGWHGPSNSNMYSVGGGSLILNDSASPNGDTLHTATPCSTNGAGFAGTVFAGGQGLYAEARLQMANTATIGGNGDPSFWLTDLDQRGLNSQYGIMPGNPTHTEGQENDILEYNPTYWTSGYSSGNLDWCSTGSGPIGMVNNDVCTGQDFTQFHVYGMLWVPASAANGWNGYRQAYVDGVPQQGQCWIGNQVYTGSFPITYLGSYLYSEGDTNSYYGQPDWNDLILGSAKGGLTTMVVDYVRVWAVNPSQSIRTLTTSGALQEGPFGGTPVSLPGKVEAENYDTGGQGVGYSISGINGSANSYRTDGVDLESAADTGGGYDVGWSNTGQWFRYTVNVASAGTYQVSFRVASPYASPDAFHLTNSSGASLSGNISIPATGGYQTWTTVTASVTLPAGQQVLTVVQDNIGYNLNYMSFARSEAPYGGVAAAVPGTIQAENYDTGGQGAGYNATDGNGTANSYRTDGVDLETCADTGGGYDLGWSSAGQWFNYTINVAAAGTYTASFRVASPGANPDAFHLQNAVGTNLTGSIVVPATGGYQTWTTVVSAPFTLPAGVQTLTVCDDNGGANLNWISFVDPPVIPAAPTGLTATAGASGTKKITLTWTASGGATSYSIYRGSTSGGESTTAIATGITAATYTNTGLTAATKYYYKVTAVNSAGTSAKSTEASATAQ